MIHRCVTLRISRLALICFFGWLQVDGWAALVVCSVIAIGGLSALVTWIGELQADLQHVLKLELSENNRIQTDKGPAREVTKSEVYSSVDQESDDETNEVDTSFS